jgi:hypothetical protein
MPAWDTAYETPEATAVLNRLLARCTLGVSRCESPECSEGEEQHLAIFAFWIDSVSVRPGVTRENFCDDCDGKDNPNASDFSTKDENNDCYGKRLIFDGVLLCTCCNVRMTVLCSEDNIKAYARPMFTENIADNQPYVSPECMVNGIKSISASVPRSKRKKAIQGVSMGALAIEITPELQAAIDNKDAEAVRRIIGPLIAEQLAADLAGDMLKTSAVRKRAKGAPKQNRISIDEVLDIEDAQIEGKTLQDFGISLHDDNV